MCIKTYKVDDGWVVSHHQCWVEGLYATEDAARKATIADVDALHELWKTVRPAPITVEQLNGLLDEDVRYVVREPPYNVTVERDDDEVLHLCIYQEKNGKLIGISVLLTDVFKAARDLDPKWNAQEPRV